MANNKNRESHRDDRRRSHMPDSTLYEWIIPVVLIGLGVLTAVLILAGLGIAFGIIPY